MFKKLMVGIAAALIAAAPAMAQDIKEINFGIISTEASQNLKSQWQPLLDDL